jgi:hypothetical protein
VERMAKRKQKSQPTWTNVKAKLAEFDRAALLGLIQSLYAAHKDNQAFLHARFGLAEENLATNHRRPVYLLWEWLRLAEVGTVGLSKTFVAIGSADLLGKSLNAL